MVAVAAAQGLHPHLDRAHAGDLLRAGLEALRRVHQPQLPRLRGHLVPPRRHEALQVLRDLTREGVLLDEVLALSLGQGGLRVAQPQGLPRPVQRQGLGPDLVHVLVRELGEVNVLRAADDEEATVALLTSQEHLVVGGAPDDAVATVHQGLPVVGHAEDVGGLGEELLLHVEVGLAQGVALVRGHDPAALHGDEGVLVADAAEAGRVPPGHPVDPVGLAQALRAVDDQHVVPLAARVEHARHRRHHHLPSHQTRVRGGPDPGQALLQAGHPVPAQALQVLPHGVDPVAAGAVVDQVVEVGTGRADAVLALDVQREGGTVAHVEGGAVVEGPPGQIPVHLDGHGQLVVEQRREHRVVARDEVPVVDGVVGLAGAGAQAEPHPPAGGGGLGSRVGVHVRGHPGHLRHEVMPHQLSHHSRVLGGGLQHGLVAGETVDGGARGGRVIQLGVQVHPDQVERGAGLPVGGVVGVVRVHQPRGHRAHACCR